MYYRDWYDGIGDGVPVKKKGENAGKNARSGARGLFATAGAVALCVMACYISGGIFGADSLSADSSAGNAALLPSPPAVNDASFVMSWVYDDADGDKSGGGADEIGKDTPDGGEERIKELAEEYISSHTKKSVADGEHGER